MVGASVAEPWRPERERRPIAVVSHPASRLTRSPDVWRGPDCVKRVFRGFCIKKRRKRMAKKKHRKLLKKTRVQRRKLGK